MLAPDLTGVRDILINTNSIDVAVRSTPFVYDMQSFNSYANSRYNVKRSINYFIIVLIILCLNACSDNPQGVPPESSRSSNDTTDMNIITDDSTVADSTPQDTTTDDITEAMIDYSDMDNLPEEYRAILNNEKEFVIDIRGRSETIYLKSYSFPYLDESITSCNDVKYAVIDMNVDGKAELLITGSCGDVLVLHSENGLVYGFDFIFRNMDNIKKDGTFDWHHMGEYGLTYGTSRLEFSGEAYIWIELCCIENDGSDQVCYYIEEGTVTLQDYLNYCNKLETIEATWFPIDLNS